MAIVLTKAKKASTSALARVLENQNRIHLRDASITIAKASDLSITMKEAIWELFRVNMEKLYKSTSVFNWDPAEKREELFNRDSRYLLVVKEGAQIEPILVAYCMFRFENEPDMEGKRQNVLYCYELQVQEARRGNGLGKYLVDMLEKIARKWCMKKIMLTVIIANAAAVKFYRREGFTTDEISPDNEEYYILSKKTS